MKQFRKDLNSGNYEKSINYGEYFRNIRKKRGFNIEEFSEFIHEIYPEKSFATIKEYIARIEKGSLLEFKEGNKKEFFNDYLTMVEMLNEKEEFSEPINISSDESISKENVKKEKTKRRKMRDLEKIIRFPTIMGKELKFRTNIGKYNVKKGNIIKNPEGEEELIIKVNKKQGQLTSIRRGPNTFHFGKNIYLRDYTISKKDVLIEDCPFLISSATATKPYYESYDRLLSEVGM